MGRRRPYRTDDREVDVELACACKLVARMTRCANDQIARTRLCAGERGSGPVNTGEPAAPRIFNGSVQQDSRTVVRRERQKAGGECIAPRYRPGFFAKLDQTQAALECALRTRQKFLFTQVHPGDSVEEKISLSERFGIWISFYPFGQDDYLAAVSAWLAHFDVPAAASARDSEARMREALQFAIQRGSRSGRVAWQFARSYAGARRLK